MVLKQISDRPDCFYQFWTMSFFVEISLHENPIWSLTAFFFRMNRMGYAWASGSFKSTFSPIVFTALVNSLGAGRSASSLIPKYSMNLGVVPYNIGRPMVSAFPVISMRLL